VYDTSNIDISSEMRMLSDKKFYKSLSIKTKLKGKHGTKKRIKKTKYTIYAGGEEIELYSFDNSIGMKLGDTWLPYKHKKQVILFLIKNIPTVPVDGHEWEMFYGIYNGIKIDMGLYKGEDKDKKGRAYIKVFNEEKFKKSYYRKLQEYNYEKHMSYVNPEIENEIYDHQEPTFTREEELNDIAILIESLRHRIVSAEEIDILRGIQSDIDNILGANSAYCITTPKI
jgi:hypothetical protein